MSRPPPVEAQALSDALVRLPWQREARVWRHVTPEGRVDWDAVLGEAWSGGERVLVEAMASLCDPPRQVSLAEVVSRLDDDNFELVLAALRAVREARR